MNTAISVIAIISYILATVMQARQLRRQELSPLLPMAVGAFAVSCHSIAAYTAIQTPDGVDLGAEQLLSLVNGLICAIALGACIRRPLHVLLLALYPLAAITLTAELIAPAPNEHLVQYSVGVASHILLSVLAYSFMTIAVVQALILANQDRMLRQHQLRGLPSMLPPLQTMETMLFEILWISIVLLSLAIASGFAYVEDMLAQHLAHKTVFSIIAWLLLAVLLWGRSALGWRGQTAIRWTLGAFGFLLLGYIGTKVALALLMP